MEDRTFRRKSKVRYHSGTKGSEGKTVYSDESQRFGTNPQSRTVVRSAFVHTTAECPVLFRNCMLEEKTIHSGSGEGSVLIRHTAMERKTEHSVSLRLWHSGD